MSIKESTPKNDSSAISSSNLSALKNRLEKYKLKDQLIVRISSVVNPDLVVR